MNLNITVNEAAGACPPPPPGTTSEFHVRAFYSEADAGHLYGPFATRCEAEACVKVLAGRADVVKAQIEEA